MELSSQKIKEILEKSKQEINSVIDSNIKAVKAGKDSVDSCMSSFNITSENVESVDSAFRTIISLCKKQGANVDQISSAFENIYKISKQNNDQADQNLKIANDLEKGSHKLNGNVLDLNSLINGSSNRKNTKLGS